jgi:hypothetical protein
MEARRRYQYRGIAISILFVIVGGVSARLGIDLGQILWITLSTFLLLAIIYLTARTIVKAARSDLRDKHDNQGQFPT